MIDVSYANVEISSGDIYIVIAENNGVLYLAQDSEPLSPEYNDRNWVNVSGSVNGQYDEIADFDGYEGDFGILVFMGSLALLDMFLMLLKPVQLLLKST